VVEPRVELRCREAAREHRWPGTISAQYRDP
jgi:hypothetical protein